MVLSVETDHATLTGLASLRRIPAEQALSRTFCCLGSGGLLLRSAACHSGHREQGRTVVRARRHGIYCSLNVLPISQPRRVLLLDISTIGHSNRRKLPEQICPVTSRKLRGNGCVVELGFSSDEWRPDERTNTNSPAYFP